ncbi:MAG: DUF2147 domain-containing protein [Cyclobacteriaceae bacterium]
MGRIAWTLFLFLIPFLFPNIASPSQDEGSAIVGRWLREDKKNYIVEIYKCGEKYCGKIVWMKEPNDEQGNPRKDLENPDQDLRGQPLIGLDVLESFAFLGQKKWDGGTIYSFNRGKKYNAKISMDGAKLQLTASILFFSRTYSWIKVK